MVYVVLILNYNTFSFNNYNSKNLKLKEMNNFHIYEEIGKGKYSLVYKVINNIKRRVVKK